MKASEIMREMSEKMNPKLCLNCKYMKIGFMDRLFFGLKFARCEHPIARDSSIDSPVDGRGWVYCYIMRLDMRLDNCGKEGKMRLDNCGKEGKLWEKK